MAAFLGSRVSWKPDTTWFWPLEGVEDLERDPSRLRRRQPLVAARPGDDQARGRALGRPGPGRYDRAMGGNLDILAALRGSQKLLLDLSDDPRAVERLAGEITQLWLRYYASCRSGDP